jgi:hypothetical protein
LHKEKKILTLEGAFKKGNLQFGPMKFTWNNGTTFECKFNKNFGFLKGKSINCYDHIFEGEVEFEERGPFEPPQVWYGVTKTTSLIHTLFL